MADGTATGLVTGRELQAEMRSMQKDMEHKRCVWLRQNLMKGQKEVF